MKVSVVVPTYNQRPRLELVLTALQCQDFPGDEFEVIVVDDASTDDTPGCLSRMKLANNRIVRLPANQGLCGARNAGMRQARGELVVFLDGDALPGPELISAYWTAHQSGREPMFLGGLHYSLPQLEYFQDPQTGELSNRPVPSVVRDLLQERRKDIVLTRKKVENDFPAIHQSAVEGGYPFPELKTLQRQATELLRQRPDSPVGWLGFFPHNGAVPRKALEKIGGFDEKIAFCEGWEIGYRLYRIGLRLRRVEGARSYHLYHYHDFSNPAKTRQERAIRQGAIDYIAVRHKDPRIRLIHFWFASLWHYPFFPASAVVGDLLEFDRRYRTLTEREWRECELLLERHPDRQR